MTDKFQDKQVQNIIFNQLSKDKYYELLKEGKIVENEFYITNDSFKDNAGGLDVLDIGQSLYVDESQGLRRYLNGSWVDINRNTQLFYERLMKAASLNPELICTEDEWNALETASPFGQVGKFVVDTIKGRVRLPKIVHVCGTLDLGKLGELDSQRFLVAKKEPTDVDNSWYNWYSDGWLEQGGWFNTVGAVDGSTQTKTIIFKVPYLSVNHYNVTLSSGVGASGWQYANGACIGGLSTAQFTVYMATGTESRILSWQSTGYGAIPTKANYNLGNATGKVSTQYPYYIQIATGLETVLNISDQIQVNSPYALGESKYSPIQLNNASWLHYSIKNNSRSLYPSYYDMLLRIYQGKETIDGITVKHVSDTTITRYDHTIDTANQTFNLPSLNGSEDVASTVLSDIIPYTIDVSGTYYTAPYNGWFYLNFPYEENKCIDMYNLTTNQGMVQTPASSGNWVRATIWCNAGDLVGIWYTTTSTTDIVFNFQIASKPGHLYYYVGETTKNADILNAGRITDFIQRNYDGDKEFYVVDSWRNGRNWWRKYSDGWMEQGGWVTMVAVKSNWSSTVINLHQPFIDTNYLCSALFPSINDGAYGTAGQPQELTRSSFVMRVYNSGSAVEPWYACGYWK